MTTFTVEQDRAPGLTEALKMIDTFVGIGVRGPSNIDEEKRGFRPKQSVEQTRRSMPYLLNSAPRRQNNVIIRPHPPRRVSNSA